MTNHANGESAPNPKKSQEAEAGNGETPETAEQADDDTVAAQEEFTRLAGENEELRDRAMRLAAEMENLRKRTARDVTEARNYGIANFARDMLTVSDDLRRALDAVPAEARTAGDSGFRSLVEGVEMTERAMLAALERHGVNKISPEGEKFDPNFHQAMFEVPDTGQPAGTVVQVVQTGYVIGDRVLRPAMVGVAKGGAAPADKQAGEAPAQQPGEADAEAEPGPPDPYSEKDA